jgi:hypothetical protein
LNRRQQLLEDLRNVLNNRAIGTLRNISTLRAYSQIRPHLRPGVREELESPRPEEEPIEEISGRIGKLKDELARIEREWGLL